MVFVSGGLTRIVMVDTIGYMNNANQEVTTADILEFLKENMVMKEDFDKVGGNVDGLKVNVDGLKEDMTGLKSSVDGLRKEMNTKLESLDSRLVEFQTELEDIKIKLFAIETRLKEDTDALNSLLFTEVGNLKKRVAFLEQKLGLQGFDFNGASI